MTISMDLATKTFRIGIPLGPCHHFRDSKSASQSHLLASTHFFTSHACLVSSFWLLLGFRSIEFATLTPQG